MVLNLSSNFIQKFAYFLKILGNLFKFIVTYKTAFWRAAGLSGEIISTGETDDPDEVFNLGIYSNLMISS